MSLTEFEIGHQNNNYLDQDHLCHRHNCHLLHKNFQGQTTVDKGIRPCLYTRIGIFKHLGKSYFILTERFEHLKLQYDCSHTETLTVLRELVQLYWKQNKTKETHLIVARLLLETTLSIISKERHAKTLYDAAKSIGGIYVMCGLQDEAKRVIYQIHRQVVSKSYTSELKVDFKVAQSVSRNSYASSSPSKRPLRAQAPATRRSWQI
jgi:hypothetical protein